MKDYIYNDSFVRQMQKLKFFLASFQTGANTLIASILVKGLVGHAWLTNDQTDTLLALESAAEHPDRKRKVLV